MILTITHSELSKFVYNATGKRVAFSQKYSDSIRVSYELDLFLTTTTVYADIRKSSLIGTTLRLNYSGSTGVGTAIDAILKFKDLPGLYHPCSGVLKICIDEIPQARPFLKDYQIKDVRFFDFGIHIEFSQK